MRGRTSYRRHGQAALPSVPIGTLVLALEALADFGIDGDAFLQSVGIAPSLMANRLTPVPVATVGRVVAEAVRQSGCPHFAVLMGAHARLDNAGILPMLLRNEACVRDAIFDLIRFLRIWYQGMHFALHVDGGSARLTVSVSGVFEGHVELCTSYVSSMLRHLEACIGRDWRASRICLARRRPRDVSAYHEALRAPVSFNEPENVIEFSAFVLDRRRDAVDARLAAYLRDQLVELESARDEGIVDQVQRIIKALLLQERCGIKLVAEAMSMHRKTLHRLLQQEGTTFELELDRLRRNWAEQMLTGSDVSIGEIALVLGYVSSANFARAFNRWHGMPPTAWRRMDS